VLTLMSTSCNAYQDWQSVAAAFAWRQSGQPGRILRVANCDEGDTLANRTSMLGYVSTLLGRRVSSKGACRHGCRALQGTKHTLSACRCADALHCASAWRAAPNLHMLPVPARLLALPACVHAQYSYYEPLQDGYPPYNRPGAMIDLFELQAPQEEWVLIIDPDILIRRPLLPENLPVRRGWAIGVRAGLFDGVYRPLEQHIYEVSPRWVCPVVSHHAAWHCHACMQSLARVYAWLPPCLHLPSRGSLVRVRHGHACCVCFPTCRMSHANQERHLCRVCRSQSGPGWRPVCVAQGGPAAHRPHVAALHTPRAQRHPGR
jgi:hypothetical protein